MARNPLIPRTPGEQAVDRLLNQTLPQLIQNQQRRQEREEDIARADRIRKEDLAIDQERYNDRIEKEAKQEKKDLEDNAYGNFIRAQDAYGKGNIELGDTYLDKSFSQYNEAGKAAPFNPEDFKKTQVDNKNIKDKFQSLQNDFYLSKNPEEDLTNLLKHYEDNSDVLDYQTTIQPVLEHVLTNYSDPRYADVYDKVDFGALKDEVKAYSVYNAQMEYKASDANFDSYVASNPNQEVNTITDAQLRAHYYKTNEAQYKGAAETYLSSTLAAHETTAMDADKLGSLSSFEQRRLDVNFKNAGATAVFADGRGYGELSDAERKEVDKYLLDRYGFPGIEYAKQEGDGEPGGNGGGGGGDSEPTEDERKARYLTLNDKGYSNLSPAERTERANLAKEFGSADEIRKQERKDKVLTKKQERVQGRLNFIQKKFDGYSELLRRFESGEVKTGAQGKLVIPSDLRYLQFSGTPAMAKRALERQQNILNNAKDELAKLQGN